MYLKLVTWSEDLQFLVNAKTEEGAINKAMKSCELYLNEEFPGEIVYDGKDYGYQNGSPTPIEDVKDRGLYEVWNVDFLMLNDLLKRSQERIGIYGEAIVFEE